MCQPHAPLSLATPQLCRFYDSTEGLVDQFNLFAKSMPKGSVPSLNIGMKSCIPASLTKGFHGYTYK